MPNYQHRGSDPYDAGHIDQPRPESFTARRIRVINALRASRRASRPRPAATSGDAQAGTGSHAVGEIRLVRSGVPLPLRTPGAQIADDAGLMPTMKYDPGKHLTAEQVAQVRTSLMELGE